MILNVNRLLLPGKGKCCGKDKDNTQSSDDDDMSGAVMGGNPVVGVTIFGHTMTVVEDVIVIAALGIILILAATFAFARQE